MHLLNQPGPAFLTGLEKELYSLGTTANKSLSCESTHHTSREVGIWNMSSSMSLNGQVRRRPRPRPITALKEQPAPELDQETDWY